nr:hypothetical protein [Bifidobacterium catenulatum]
MTDLKMFSKPVVFTDFDGVLNAFPDDKLLRRGGVNKLPDLGEARQSLRENVQS